MKKIAIKGKTINPIGIGTWLMGGGIYENLGITYANYDEDDKHIKAIKYSIAKGQNHIDTAQMYGAGHTEEIVGEAIKGTKRDTLFIADKLWKSHMRRSSVIPAVKDMLTRLETDFIDLLYVHSPRVPEPMEEYILGINDAIKQGFVHSIGVSNFNTKQLKEAIELSDNKIVTNQIHYNILMRDFATAEMLKFCENNEILIVAYKPLEGKLLADSVNNETVLTISKKYNKTPSQIAINWLISQDNVVSIPKASNKDHIDENLAALDIVLEEEDIETLNQIN